VHSQVPFVYGADRPKRQLAASKCDRRGGHGCPVKASKTMFPIAAVLSDTRCNQRMRNLHEHGARARETTHEFAIDAPKDGGWREDRMSHVLNVTQSS